MKEKFKNKWIQSWFVLVLIVIWYSFFLCYNQKESWFNSYMQIGYIIIFLIAMVLIMLQTFYEANKSASEQIAVYKEESLKQISAISLSTKTQIDQIRISTKEQIFAFQELTDKQISTLQSESEKQTKLFVQQIDEVTTRLENIVEQLMKLHNQNEEMLQTERELKTIEEDKRKREIENNFIATIEKNQEIERIKPAFHVLFNFGTEWYYLWEHLYFSLYNNGADAKAIIINITFNNSYTNYSKTISQRLKGMQSLTSEIFDIGRKMNFESFDKVIIEIIAHDKDHRQYRSNWIFNFEVNKWLNILFAENNRIEN